MLSLANETTVVGDVSGTLLDFIAHWVQTPSDYEFIIAKTISKDWAKKHMPVLSRHGHDPTRYTVFNPWACEVPVPMIPQDKRDEQDDHILYTKFNIGQPVGKIVLCHLMCGQEIENRQGKLYIRLICKGCGSRCSIGQFKTDRTMVLGRRELVAVKYPQDQHPAEWKLPKEGNPKVSSLRLSATQPTMKRSKSLLSVAPNTMARSISLPTPSTSTAQSSSPLYIRIPSRASAQLISPGKHRTTATSPPSPEELPEPRKRTLYEMHGVWPKKKKK